MKENSQRRVVVKEKATWRRSSQGSWPFLSSCGFMHAMRVLYAYMWPDFWRVSKKVKLDINFFLFCRLNFMFGNYILKIFQLKLTTIIIFLKFLIKYIFFKCEYAAMLKYADIYN